MIEYGLYWMGKAAGRGGTKEGAYIVERKFACLLACSLARLAGHSSKQQQVRE